MDFAKTAKEILAYVGGRENVSHVIHCATRLRFNLKDSSLADVEKIKALPGVFGVVDKAGQFQIIIGNDVPKVYKELVKIGDFKDSTEPDEGKKKLGISAFFELISGIFVPVIPAITGCGLLKAFLTLLVTFNMISPESQTYYIFEFVGDTGFYFLPVFLAYTAAVKFKCSPYLAMALGGMLLHPKYSALVSAGDPVFLMGLPVTLAKYSSSVFPIILIVWVLSYVQRFWDKVVPKQVKLVFVPLLTMAVMTPITFVAVGPLGNIIGNFLAAGITFIDSKASWVLPLFMGTMTPLMVMTGMHYSMMPVSFAQMAAMGYQTLSPGMLCSNMAQSAASFCVGIKAKNNKLKQLGISTGITAFCGITEPALYGVTMKLKRPLYAVMIGGGCAGLYMGITGVKVFSPNGSNIFRLPGYIGDNPMNIVNALIGLVITFVVTFVLTWIFGFEDEVEIETSQAEERKEEHTQSLLEEKLEIVSPVNGKSIPLGEVPDEAFASEMMGKGIAVVPSEGKLYAPVDGTIVTVFRTKHAIGIRSDQGTEVLIHVGLDTVRLEGEHFYAHVKDEDKVRAGQLLLEFDLEEIRRLGYDMTTPILITNSDHYQEIAAEPAQDVKAGNRLLTLLEA